MRRELTDHFVEALRDCESEQERNILGEKLIAEFGEAKVLGKLIRRGKKRCRPWWQKAMIRSVQVFLVGIILCVGYTVWFVKGKPTVRVDYLAKMNQVARPEIESEQNGWPHLEKAIELYVDYKEIKPDESTPYEYSLGDSNNHHAKISKWEFLYERTPFESLSAEQREMLLKWLNRNEPVWEKFVQIAGKPYCWQEYDHQGQDVYTWLNGVIIPEEISRLPSFARMGTWRARIALAEGQK